MRRPVLATALTLAALLLLARPSLAQPFSTDAHPSTAPSPQASPPSPFAPGGPLAPLPDVDRPERRWYGGQTLALDLAAVGLGVIGVYAQPREPFMIAAGSAFFLGAPVVHWSHGHVGKGFASLAMRAGAPLLGAALVTRTVDDSANTSARQALGAALLIAWIPGSMLVDSLVIAREDVRPTRASLVPTAQPLAGGAALGAAGTW